jgi:hypothetical protein
MREFDQTAATKMLPGILVELKEYISETGFWVFKY